MDESTTSSEKAAAPIRQMSLPDWHSLWQVITVVSLAFAFAGGLGTYLTGKWLSDRQAAEIRVQSVTIAELKEAAGKQEGKNKELEAANIEARRALEDEHNKRLELEKSLVPREFGIRGLGDGATDCDSLKEFAGIRAIIIALPDAEPRRAASFLAGGLKSFGWDIAPIQIQPELINRAEDSGVMIKPFGSWFPSSDDRPVAEWCSAAGDELVAVLRAKGWAAKIVPDIKQEVPQNTIQIEIGFKPPHFKEAHEARRDQIFERVEEEWRKIRKGEREGKRYKPNFPPLPPQIPYSDKP